MSCGSVSGVRRGGGERAWLSVAEWKGTLGRLRAGEGGGIRRKSVGCIIGVGWLRTAESCRRWMDSSADRLIDCGRSMGAE